MRITAAPEIREVVNGTVTDVSPGAMVALSGTWAIGLLLWNVTRPSPGGTAPLTVTVPLTVAPLSTLFGVMTKETSPGGKTVSVAVAGFGSEAVVAVTVPVVLVSTFPALMVKETEV